MLLSLMWLQMWLQMWLRTWKEMCMLISLIWSRSAACSSSSPPPEKADMWLQMWLQMGLQMWLRGREGWRSTPDRWLQMWLQMWLRGREGWRSTPDMSVFIPFLPSTLAMSSFSRSFEILPAFFSSLTFFCCRSYSFLYLPY